MQDSAYICQYLFVQISWSSNGIRYHDDCSLLFTALCCSKSCAKALPGCILLWHVRYLVGSPYHRLVVFYLFQLIMSKTLQLWSLAEPTPNLNSLYGVQLCQTWKAEHSASLLMSLIEQDCVTHYDESMSLTN